MHELGGLLAERDRLQFQEQQLDRQRQDLADLQAERVELSTRIDRLYAAYREMLVQFERIDLARLSGGNSDHNQAEIAPGYYQDWWCDLSDLLVAKDRLQGRAYWGGSTELANARKLARAQMPALWGQKFERPIPCALYIGTPDIIYDRHRRETGLSVAPISTQIQSRHHIQPFKRIETDRSLYFPDMHKGTAVFGAAGSGKSYGVFNPLLRSAIDLGIHTILYDFKYPEQTQEIAGYAAERGYRVQIFAPSFPESQALNLLDFVRDAGDALGARQLARVLAKNTHLNRGNQSSSNREFFDTAGENLVCAAMMLAKWLEAQRGNERFEACAREIWGDLPRPPLDDLLSVAAIVNLPHLSGRIAFAQNRLDPWNLQAFAQLISTSSTNAAEVNITQAGIVATAQTTLDRLVTRDFVPTIATPTTLDIDLDGSIPTLTIVGVNQDYRDAISPPLATALDRLVSRNLARSRTSPLFLCLDELPSLYLPRIGDWLAEGRSVGLCAAIGLQHRSQLTDIYGEHQTNSMLANCATKFFFNPQDIGTARAYSEYLGKRELRASSTHAHTASDGTPHTATTESAATVPLMEPDEFLRMGTGRAVVISPGYQCQGRQEAYVPLLLDICVPERDLEESARSRLLWEKMRATDRPELDGDLAAEFDRRRRFLELFFPLPEQKVKKAISSQQSAVSSQQLACFKMEI